MAPGNKLHDSSSQRRTRIITFNKELYVCLRVFMGFPGILPRHSRWGHQSKPYAVYINAHSALRSSLIKMMWCLRRVHGILTCSVLSTRRRSSVTLPSGLRGILTCRVLSTRRRRAVRLPSGLRVLFSQLLFCLVHVT